MHLKTGAWLPDGSAPTIPGRCAEEAIGSGATVIPLFAGFVLPPGFPRRRLPDRGRPPRAQAGRDDQPALRPLTLGP